MNKEILRNNKAGWDIIADGWFGSTSLPIYAPNMKTETELKLFGEIKDKKVLDIGCGSGHSLRYMGEQGAKELWGLDMSSTQIKNAKTVLNESGYTANLFEAPMEENPGIPEGYFDIVYSIYAFGWTVDLEHSLKQVSKYLKPGGVFIFSWDHPLVPCLDTSNNQIIISKSYHPLSTINMGKGGETMTFTKWKMSSYIDGFKKAGLYLDTLIEDIDEKLYDTNHDDLSRYYSKEKSKFIPLSMIMKVIKK